MSKKSTTASFPIFGILGLIFITLKLAGIGVVAQWSWWWVLAPFWIGIGFVLAIALVAFVGVIIATIVTR